MANEGVDGGISWHFRRGAGLWMVKKGGMMSNNSYISGLTAEQQIADLYERNGFDVVARRYRSKHGEIDIVAHHAGKYYFVEVKKSGSLDKAASRICSRQIGRIRDAALDFLSRFVGHLSCDCRFDAALVDCRGKAKVLPNAF